MTRALRNNKKSQTEMLRREEANIQAHWEEEQAHIDAHQARFETYKTRLADIQARLAADGDERPPTLENKQCIHCVTSSYEVEFFHPDAPFVRHLVNTQVRSEHQEMFYCFRSCGAAWGNVTSDQDILDMAEHLRVCTRCPGIYTTMDPIDDERFEAVKKDCTAVRVTYDNNRAPDGKIVTMPEYLAPGDPLPVFSTFDELDANAD